MTLLRIVIFLVLCCFWQPVFADDTLDSLFEKGRFNIELKPEYRSCSSNEDCTYISAMCADGMWLTINQPSKEIVSNILGNTHDPRFGPKGCPNPMPQYFHGPVVHCVKELCQFVPDDLHDILGSDEKLKSDYRTCSTNDDCTVISKSCTDVFAVNKSLRESAYKRIGPVSCFGTSAVYQELIKCVEGLCEYTMPKFSDIMKGDGNLKRQYRKCSSNDDCGLVRTLCKDYAVSNSSQKDIEKYVVVIPCMGEIPRSISACIVGTCERSEALGRDGQLYPGYRKCSSNDDCAFARQSCDGGFAVNKLYLPEVIRSVSCKYTSPLPWAECLAGICQAVPSSAK